MLRSQRIQSMHMRLNSVTYTHIFSHICYDYKQNTCIRIDKTIITILVNARFACITVCFSYSRLYAVPYCFCSCKSAYLIWQRFLDMKESNGVICLANTIAAFVTIFFIQFWLIIKE